LLHVVILVVTEFPRFPDCWGRSPHRASRRVADEISPPKKNRLSRRKAISPWIRAGPIWRLTHERGCRRGRWRCGTRAPRRGQRCRSLGCIAACQSPCTRCHWYRLAFCNS